MRDDLGKAPDYSSSQIVLLCDNPRSFSPSLHHGLFTGYQWHSLQEKMRKVGIVPDLVRILSHDTSPDMLHSLEALVFIAMGEQSLRLLTGRRGIDKWQLSPLDTLPEFRCRKCIPTFDMTRIQKQYELGLYQELALRRALAESKTTTYERTPERFLLNPSVEETLAVLDFLLTQPTLAVDVETGYGQINTVGFAWSPSDAIAINVLPARLEDHGYYRLWQAIARVLEGPSLKVFQNFIYDTSYFSAYGIRVSHTFHDTMWAQKFLYPELDMNLGNVGRMYTNRPYWKDDGKVEHEEGKKKDWGNVRDWTKHYLYNCRDTTGTFEGHLSQRVDLKGRGLLQTFDGYVMRLADPILEMCSNGMPLDLTVREALKRETESKIKGLTEKLHTEVGRELNPRSPKQVMGYLKEQGIALPKKYDKAKGNYRESADASSIKKIRLKYPDLKPLGTLADIRSLDKALGSYINFEVKAGEELLRYSLNGTGTETLRFAGNKDPWDRGFNIQTIPREGGDVSIKSMFVAPPGQSFVEVDLRQAESRFVAYDSADATLIDMLESGADVHSYVANEILRQLGYDVSAMSKEEFKSTWRQLGKKSSHGFNYNMKASVFIETVFNEMDVVLSRKDAEVIREVYFKLFPGIPKWHEWIRGELQSHRKLTAPSGWERYFYGRLGDDMFKEAYAWRPQHTIPWITNHLMFHLRDERRRGNCDLRVLVQVHDALYLLVPDEGVECVAKICLDHRAWHPEVVLKGGKLVIPVEIKQGKIVSELKEVHYD